MSAEIQILKTPYPYKAMLSICSDLDETPSLDCYLTTSAFLNTTSSTRFGTGLGLETGNSIYFMMQPGEFSYDNLDGNGQAAIRTLIKSGHIDCLHSFGDLATSRKDALRCLETLRAEDCKLLVWIDHAVAPTNFGKDIMRGNGDIPGAAAFHADLSYDYGIRYIWRGRVTSIQGQDAPVSFRGIWSAAMPMASSMTLVKEVAKHCFAWLGSEKYRLHKRNRILSKAQLSGSREVFEFLRVNPHPEGVSGGDNSAGLAQVLSESFLSQLSRRRGKAIIYTHLGKAIDQKSGFTKASVEALRRLKQKETNGEILVTTTRRLLDFANMCDMVEWTSSIKSERLEICVTTKETEFDWQGLSFQVPTRSNVSLVVNGKNVHVERHRIHDDSEVVSVPWQRLAFPF